jgi:hypothetical protein
MHLFRVRFTVRRIMIIVAVAGIVFGVEATRRRWAYFRVMAKELALNEEQCRSMARSMQLGGDRGPASEREEMREKAAEYNRIADELSKGRGELERKW